MAARRKKKVPRKPIRPEPIPPGATQRASEHDLRPGEPVPRSPEDADAYGTPAGGTELGGLAGTNVGDGAPENVDTGEALGRGDEEPEAVEESSYGGPHGGAVGGTPAQGRVSGGHMHDGLRPGGDRPADSTIGADPETPKP